MCIRDRDYLTGLAGNNNREWYHAHKKEYQEANEEFIALLQELIWRIGEKDSSILHNDPRDLKLFYLPVSSE